MTSAETEAKEITALLRPPTTVAEVIERSSEYVGRELEFVEAKRKYRGRIAGMKIIRGTRHGRYLGTLYGAVISFVDTVEADSTSDTWTYREVPNRRDLILTPQDLETPVRDQYDGFLGLPFGQGSYAIIYPVGQVLDRTKITRSPY